MRPFVSGFQAACEIGTHHAEGRKSYLEELSVVCKIAIDDQGLPAAVVLGNHQAAQNGTDILHLGVHPLRLVPPAQDVHLRTARPEPVKFRTNQRIDCRE